MDVRDAVGDRLHISDEFKKDGVSFLNITRVKERTDENCTLVRPRSR